MQYNVSKVNGSAVFNSNPPPPLSPLVCTPVQPPTDDKLSDLVIPIRPVNRVDWEAQLTTPAELGRLVYHWVDTSKVLSAEQRKGRGSSLDN